MKIVAITITLMKNIHMGITFIKMRITIVGHHNYSYMKHIQYIFMKVQDIFPKLNMLLDVFCLY